MITDEEIIELEAITRLEDAEKGAGNFWHFCCLKAPNYFSDDKPHLKLLVETLQAFYERKLLKPDGTPYRKLMINIPPRHGKSRTLINFCQWVLGKNQNERIIECSYNDDAAGDFAKYTRDGIQEERIDESHFVTTDFFPDLKIKFGSQSYYKWALEGQHFNYLGAGIGGSITGKGGSILIVDDPIKLVEEAFNEDRLEKIWQWYTGTFLSRGDSETGEEPLEIIVMTRWANGDLCGRILASDKAADWYQLKMEVYDKDADQMLCPRTLSKMRYDDLKSQMVSEVFWANYHQETIETKGLLYKSLKTYDDVPRDEKKNSLIESVENYTDTADEGDDFLVSINFGIYKGEGYILDVLYTKQGMEKTEPATAKFLFDSKVNEARIESNNGGRGFARNVERLLWENYKTKSITIKWFHQSENKVARILSNSAFVQNHLYFPLNWKDRWPEFYKAMTTYLKEGKNKHDDAQDCITGVAEMISKPSGFYSLSSRQA
jgi:predicted phage terminase large subunit-like protein